MGRSTRFFGARVLRSGRRVWTGPTAENLNNSKKGHKDGPIGPVVGFASEDEELVDLKSVVSEGVGFNGFKRGSVIEGRVLEVVENGNGFGSEMRIDVDVDVDVEEGEEERRGLCEIEEKEVEGVVDKMYGLVYRRKRTREKDHGDLQYFRRKKRRGDLSNGYLHEKSEFGAVGWKGQRRRLLRLSIVVGSFGGSYGVISSLLHSVLRYLSRADIRLQSLCDFVCSEPIVHVFAAHGIRFLQNFTSVGEVGSCIITNARSSIPVFSVDFAALPFVFSHLHSSLSLWNARPIYFCETNLSSSEEEKVELNSINEFSSFIPSKRDPTGCEFAVGIGATVVALPAVRANKVGSQSVHIKKGCKVQKRSDSVRKRGRSSSISPASSLSPVHISNGASLSNILRPRHNSNELSSQVSKRQLRSSNRRKGLTDVKELQSTLPEMMTQSLPDVKELTSTLPEMMTQSLPDVKELTSTLPEVMTQSLPDVKELKSTLPEMMTQKIGSASCSTNILVIESSKCYRVEGALTVLELSESNQWVLAIKKDGVKWYSITAQRVMRPCGSNRITHDIIWSRDNDLKLEFPNRQDWLIFKELYKECFMRNLQMPVPSFIPVPCVSEVEGYGKNSCLPFMRPQCYISVKDDELARALKKRTANYDMDSDDEEWLHKFNSVYNAESDIDEDLSAERFELIIDAFEKACHCNPDVITNAEAAYSIFPELERKVVEAVYGHWILKRKSNRAALVRVFQFYQPRKSQLISKFNSRKKRSFKRQGSQAGRGDKQKSFFHAFVAEQDAIEQQKILKVQEAKATLERLESVASQKRRRAQELFEIADLAAYKALMAVRISEAAQHSESTHVAASYILG